MNQVISVNPGKYTIQLQNEENETEAGEEH